SFVSHLVSRPSSSAYTTNSLIHSLPYTTLFRSIARQIAPRRSAGSATYNGPRAPDRASGRGPSQTARALQPARGTCRVRGRGPRSEEHTYELPSRGDIVCLLLLDNKRISQNSSQ